jgi:hypothetical protein
LYNFNAADFGSAAEWNETLADRAAVSFNIPPKMQSGLTANAHCLSLPADKTLTDRSRGNLFRL